MAKHPEMQYYSVNEIENCLGSVRMEDFVRQSEEAFLQTMSDIAADIAWNPSIKVIFISGPTSSGKTTSTARLLAALSLRGKHAVQLSLDDYYLNHEKPKVIEGRYDYESPETLELDLIRRHIEALLAGEAVQVPAFDFKTRTREWPAEKIVQLKKDSILLVEGLHGLSRSVAGRIERKNWYGIMLRPWATLTADRTLLSARDLRMLRRISRDAHSRNTPALATIDYWPMLDLTEEYFFAEYTERADVFINTCVPYEFCIIPHLAVEEINRDLCLLEKDRLIPSPYIAPPAAYADLDKAVEQAKRLVSVTKKLPKVAKTKVPHISILNEFIH